MNASASDPATGNGCLETIGFYALAFFIFSVFSAAIDYIHFLHIIRPSLVAAILGLLIVVASGRFVVLVRHKVTLMFVALTLWFMVCVPFSVWKGGAVKTLSGEWRVTMLTLILAAGLVSNYEQFRKIVHLIGYSSIILSLLALKVNVRTDGRLFLPNSHYGNPNDLAMILLTALPFLGFMAMRKDNGFRRVVALGGFGLILMVIANTGSRSVMVGAAVTMVAAFFYVSFAGKVKLAVGVAVAFLALAVTLPSELADRFSTVFGESSGVYDSENFGIVDSAIASAYSRRQLLLDSIELTLRNPIFGVGVGLFPVAQDNLAQNRGETMGSWRVTHNTFTQMSSEAGFPGLAIFLLAIFFSFRSLSHTLRMPVPAGSGPWQDIHMAALSLRISLLAFLSCAFFASMAYQPILALLCGLAISLEFCTRNLLAATPRPIPLAPNARQPVRANPRRPLPAFSRQLRGG